ncbi:fumarylacetoacetate hydrolase family protein [Streptomyces sp. NPDC006540]|uniref:fumarylacetoacetate hydrolase family protein n=1 Tax=Streptomyces sp. NPDC006540 TaxID=3155353 RepID=UPI0033A208F3
MGGTTRQRTDTTDLIFGVRELIAYTSSVMTLHPGDVTATGTPAGVGPLSHGTVSSWRSSGSAGWRWASTGPGPPPTSTALGAATADAAERGRTRTCRRRATSTRQ